MTEWKRKPVIIGLGRKRARVGIAVASVLLSLGLLLKTAVSQTQFLEFQRLMQDLGNHRQPPKDTEFVFARVQFTSNGPGRGARGFRQIEGWAHDYPDAEEHILQLAKETTGINLSKMSYVIVRMDSEEIFRYPFAYFSEVGEMTLTPKEVENLREYLKRGGFIMVDDFD